MAGRPSLVGVGKAPHDGEGLQGWRWVTQGSERGALLSSSSFHFPSKKTETNSRNIPMQLTQHVTVLGTWTMAECFPGGPRACTVDL